MSHYLHLHLHRLIYFLILQPFFHKTLFSFYVSLSKTLLYLYHVLFTKTLPEMSPRFRTQKDIQFVSVTENFAEIDPDQSPRLQMLRC